MTNARCAGGHGQKAVAVLAHSTEEPCQPWMWKGASVDGNRSACARRASHGWQRARVCATSGNYEGHLQHLL
jgi:hypothetical protein